MLESEDVKFAVIMATMATGYQIDISEATTEVYFMFLKDLPLEKIHKAIIEIMATHESFKLPSIALIRKKALNVDDKQMEDLAVVAWGEVLQTMGHGPIAEKDGQAGYTKTDYNYGTAGEGAVMSYVPIRNDVNQAVKIAFGGWAEFGKRSLKDDTWDRYHFIQCFKALAREEQKKLLLGEAKIRLLKE